jgi:hypothetical protein
VTFPSLSFSVPTGTVVRLTVSCAIGGLSLPQVMTATLTVRGCPAGYRTVGSASDDCAVCPVGTWPSGTGATCSQCPSPGLLCGGESAELRLQRGYLAVQGADTVARLFSLGVAAATARQLSANATDADQGLITASQLTFAPCVPPDACIVAADGRTVSCDAGRGYTGPFCASCADGWTRVGQDCLRCPGSAGSVLLVLLALMASGLGAWLFVDCGGARLRLLQLARLLSVRLRFCRSGGCVLHSSYPVESGSPKTGDGTRASSSLSSPGDQGVFAGTAVHLSTLALLLQLGPVPPVYRLALQTVSIPFVPFGLLALLDLPSLQCLPGWTLLAKVGLTCGITAFTACLLAWVARGGGTGATSGVAFSSTQRAVSCPASDASLDRPSAIPRQHHDLCGPVMANAHGDGLRARLCTRLFKRPLWRTVAPPALAALAAVAFPSLCVLSARLMTCLSAIDGVSHLAADPSLACHTLPHSAALAVCALLSLVFLVLASSLTLYPGRSPLCCNSIRPRGRWPFGAALRSSAACERLHCMLTDLYRHASCGALSSSYTAQRAPAAATELATTTPVRCDEAAAPTERILRRNHRRAHLPPGLVASFAAVWIRPVVLALLQLAATSPSATASTQSLCAPLALAGAVVWLLAELLLATCVSPIATARHGAATTSEKLHPRMQGATKGDGARGRAQVLQLLLLLLVAVLQLVYAGAQAAVTANEYDAPSAHWSPALLTEIQWMARAAPTAQACSGVALVALLVAYVGSMAWATCRPTTGGSLRGCPLRSAFAGR